MGNKRDGVTLIELIIVMVIIAVGATLMVPAIGAWLPNYRLRSATRDIVSTMRTAQMRAVSNNFQYRVNMNASDVSANSYVLQRNTGGLWVNDEALQTLPSGITIFRNTFNNQRTEFNPNSTSSAGSITLQNTRGTQRRVIIAAATGRVRIE
jgi:type IV fimbrial biogenesis protein FimT